MKRIMITLSFLLVMMAMGMDLYDHTTVTWTTQNGVNG